MRKICLVSAVLLLSGCESQPKMAPLLSMPVQESESTDLIEVKVLLSDEKTLNENIIQQHSHKIKTNSSIVINVPEGFFEEKSVDIANNQEFKTKDFFNEAEQQIEKELIRRGFRVLSRSKFEAKLRSLRDEAECNYSDWRCVRSKAASELQHIIDETNKKYQKGLISSDEFAEEMKKFRGRLQTAAAGKKRDDGERELTDISEVIRAAESGDVHADYILQINIFETNQPKKVSLDLRHNSDVRDFIRSKPGLINASNVKKLEISCFSNQAQLNAKLIHVKTGAIVWIGEHSLNEYSAGVTPLGFELGSKRYAANAYAVRSFVESQNTEFARINRYGKNIDVPSYNYKEELVPPALSAGKCPSRAPMSNDETKISLARQVAKQLIYTIKMN